MLDMDANDPQYFTIRPGTASSVHLDRQHPVTGISNPVARPPAGTAYQLPDSRAGGGTGTLESYHGAHEPEVMCQVGPCDQRPSAAASQMLMHMIRGDSIS
jgi:hypothetical protein